VAALAAVDRPLPGGGPVHVVHVEDSAVAVDASFPVCGDTQEHTLGQNVQDLELFFIYRTHSETHCRIWID